MTLLDQVCGALDAAGVRAALIGAAALAAAGVARSTCDVDLLTTDASSLGEDVWTDVRAGLELLPLDARQRWSRVRRG